MGRKYNKSIGRYPTIFQIIERINESNERRLKLIKAGATKAEIEAFDASELELRHKFEQQ